jgi:hypothetical protein
MIFLLLFSNYANFNATRKNKISLELVLVDPSSVSALLLDDRDAPCNSAMANWIVTDLVLNRVLNRSKDSMASLACSICLSHVHNLAVAVSL